MMRNKSYFFSNKENNIKVSVFSVENEDIAWFQLEEKLKRDAEVYERDVPSVKEFEIVQIC